MLVVRTDTIVCCCPLSHTFRRAVSHHLAHPEEVPCKLQLNVHEDDVMHWVEIAPNPDLIETRQQTVARRKRIYDGDVKHEPSVAKDK